MGICISWEAAPRKIRDGVDPLSAVVGTRFLLDALVSVLPEGEGQVMKRRIIIGGMLVAAVGLGVGVMKAAGPPETNLLERFAALEAQVRALQHQLSAQGNSPVMALNSYLTVDVTQHRVRFTGANLQLVNGTGKTDTTNGRGNLILGYDLARDDETYVCSDGQFLGQEPCERTGQTWAVSHKTGSHDLVIGDKNNYSQYGGLVVGLYNTSNAPSASVSGGMSNTARAPAASVSGGRDNKATGLYSSVSGGQGNTANAIAASVSRGVGNTAGEIFASVSGGLRRTAAGPRDWTAGRLFQDE
jgi:hypothetical protein